MAHDGFPGAFNELPWPLTQAATAAGAPFDALQAQLPYPLAGAEWEHDAAMSSLVPSPASTVGGAGVHEAVLMEHLASRLGVSMPSPPLPSPSSRYGSCYSTPVGSPSKPVNAAANVGFTERAARLPCFTASNGKLSRVTSSQSLLAEQTSSPRGVAPAHGSSSDGPNRKRKAAAGGKSKAKDTMTTATAKSPEAERRAKKSKLSADVGDDDQPRPAAGEAGHGNDKGKELVAEPPKDYIHVRARRGQATDSHSLAERVRREKISERMKLLQDIVPGCSKVTGKAVMLDEIINYVQSLQRQVEFLSMKLSTVNPRLEVDVDSFVQKDANQSCVPAPTSLPQPPPPPVYSTEGSNTAFCYTSSPAPAVPSPVTANAKSFEPSSLVSHGSIQDHSLEGFENSNPHQIASPWVDDLQSLVQMGFRGNT